MFLQDLIDFCKDIGLQSSAAATRNATVKLIGVLHKFVGPGDTFSPSSFIHMEGMGLAEGCIGVRRGRLITFPLLADIKGFLTDVKPALLSTLDAEYEKNPHEVISFL